MPYHNIFNNKFLDFYEKEYLEGSIFVQSFSLFGYDELKSRTFLVFSLKIAAFWTLTNHGLVPYRRSGSRLSVQSIYNHGMIDPKTDFVALFPYRNITSYTA